jgi:hypothetical protein
MRQGYLQVAALSIATAEGTSLVLAASASCAKFSMNIKTLTLHMDRASTFDLFPRRAA